MTDQLKYFFIRGHARSGTNWLSSILNLHPKIYCDGEFNFSRYQEILLIQSQQTYTPFAKFPLTRMTAHESLNHFIKATLNTLLQFKSEAKWVGDRSPTAILPLSLPLNESKYFYLIRDGRDVVVSWIYHCLFWADTFETDVYPNLLKEKIAVFKRDPNYFQENPEVLLDNEELLKIVVTSWTRSVNSYLNLRNATNFEKESVKLVKYENLIEHAEQEIPELYEFLNLDPSEAESISLETRTIPGFSDKDNNSFYRSGQIGDWKLYFTKKNLEIFNEIAGDVMEKFGYY